ncbi:STING domain-containing protein [Marinoscillum luteum]|uniref:STING domain-containing protein n=1 Tax=Marinoscillum luteum TaxID=861051 RepID=A0ABW7N6Z5_9BACT
MKLKQYLVGIYNRNSRVVKIGHYAVIAITIVAFLLWFLPIEVKYFDPEAAFTILFALSASYGVLFKILLDEAEFSPSLALAFGYVENFLEPAITQLIQDEENPIFHIYKPDSIQELFEKNIERTRKAIEAKGFKLSDIVLEPRYSRARDVILIEKEEGNQTYFDFPGTLKSLLPYIDYKIASRSNESDIEEKERLGKKLIEKFFKKTEELIAKKELSAHIKICDKQLYFDM